MTVAESFANKARAAREAAGLSQEECAFRADIHRTQISFIETGQRLPRLETLVKLAGALEVEPAELIGPIRWRPAVHEPGGFEFGEDA